MGILKSKVVLLSFGVLVIVMIVLSVLFLLQGTAPKSVQQTISKNPAPAATPMNNIKKDIQIAFPGAKDKGVMAYIDLASAEKKPLQSYLYITKAFDKMVASFKTAKSAEKLLAMINLQNYAKTLPNYKESDFVIPK